ncbi:VOC family protein [Sphingosinicella terrae]|uniref:VOC family protein n=1 Tax=Sphingosinicella terrae TaxID=2172047 RepID=UPI000E0D1D41|nr:VOC family protein [Sphingosinicella terrae]
MQQQIAVVTLAARDLSASRHFYVDGFGWTPAFENDEIVFYQMNGLVLATWLACALEADMERPTGPGPAGFALAHNVGSAAEVASAMARLLAAGGRLLRPADAPPQGGLRGYVADPDDHAWEIAWNPAWPIDAQGHVTFAA